MPSGRPLSRRNKRSESEKAITREDIDNLLSELFFQLTNIKEIESGNRTDQSGPGLHERYRADLSVRSNPENRDWTGNSIRVSFERPVCRSSLCIGSRDRKLTCTSCQRSNPMKEIKTTHVGSLPRPAEMIAKVLRKEEDHAGRSSALFEERRGETVGAGDFLYQQRRNAAAGLRAFHGQPHFRLRRHGDVPRFRGTWRNCPNWPAGLAAGTG